MSAAARLDRLGQHLQLDQVRRSLARHQRRHPGPAATGCRPGRRRGAVFPTVSFSRAALELGVQPARDHVVGQLVLGLHLQRIGRLEQFGVGRPADVLAAVGAHIFGGDDETLAALDMGLDAAAQQRGGKGPQQQIVGAAGHHPVDHRGVLFPGRDDDHDEGIVARRRPGAAAGWWRTVLRRRLAPRTAQCPADDFCMASTKASRLETVSVRRKPSAYMAARVAVRLAGTGS